jgi:phosphoribosylanthranilate isomerase
LRERLLPYVPHVNAFLFDTYVQDIPGGTGKTFSWDIVAGLGLDLPVFLAGGLTPDNAEQAVETVHPFGIDVASGVEERPGAKDFEAIDRLFAAVSRFRGAEDGSVSR